AANPRIYGQMVALLGKYSKFASAGDKATVRAAVAELATGSALEAVAEQVAPVDLTATLPDAPF
ncbi:inositol monophosphatase, partial [bacterium]|nr:inositol monophosphatase [bacterium]